MNVELDLSSTDDWDLVVRYAPWSINVDVYDPADYVIANFQDCGHLVSTRLSADPAGLLADELAGHLRVETVDLHLHPLSCAG